MGGKYWGRYGGGGAIIPYRFPRQQAALPQTPPIASLFCHPLIPALNADVVEFLHKHCPVESGLMIFQRINQVPGYKIRWLGDPKKRIVKMDGLQLVQEKTGAIPE